jgi:membrane protein involved in colicin uptake
LEQRTTLYNDLRDKEAKEASAVEKRVGDEQVTVTCHHEEHDAANRAAEAEHILARATAERAHREAEAKATAEVAAQAAAAFKRADDAFQRAQAARDAEVKNAEDKAKAAREAEACLATAIAAEGQAHHERGSSEANCHHHHAGYGAGYGGVYGGQAGYGYGYGRY